ncbi:MAG: hypothetical protein ABI765_09010 [Gemmatimonadota bacterium]
MTAQPGHFDYYMLRLTSSADEPQPIAGLAELLRTGEKRSFDSGDQLLRLIAEWSTRTAPPDSIQRPPP